MEIESVNIWTTYKLFILHLCILIDFSCIISIFLLVSLRCSILLLFKLILYIYYFRAVLTFFCNNQFTFKWKIKYWKLLNRFPLFWEISPEFNLAVKGVNWWLSICLENSLKCNRPASCRELNVRRAHSSQWVLATPFHPFTYGLRFGMNHACIFHFIYDPLIRRNHIFPF